MPLNRTRESECFNECRTLIDSKKSFRVKIEYILQITLYKWRMLEVVVTHIALS